MTGYSHSETPVRHPYPRPTDPPPQPLQLRRNPSDRYSGSFPPPPLALPRQHTHRTHILHHRRQCCLPLTCHEASIAVSNKLEPFGTNSERERGRIDFSLFLSSRLSPSYFSSPLHFLFFFILPLYFPLPFLLLFSLLFLLPVFFLFIFFFSLPLLAFLLPLSSSRLFPHFTLIEFSNINQIE